MSRRALLIPVLALAVFVGAVGVTSAQAGVSGVWMAGPGCGGDIEWFQHPDAFPYFCDGNADVEKAHWRDWGAAKATATAVFNEAALNSHNNVATAPRRRSAVTIVASQVKLCGGRHAYTRIVITHRTAVNGVKKMDASGFLPDCSTPGQTGNRKLADFLSPDRKVWCLFSSGEGFCGARVSPGESELAGWISRSGRVTTCSVAVPSLEESCFQNWDTSSPVLHYGEWTQSGSIRCKSALDGITCIKVSDPGRGNGFRVNGEEVLEVGGAASEVS